MTFYRLYRMYRAWGYRPTLALKNAWERIRRA